MKEKTSRKVENKISMWKKIRLKLCIKSVNANIVSWIKLMWLLEKRKSDSKDGDLYSGFEDNY